MEGLHDKLGNAHRKRVSDRIWAAADAAQFVLNHFRAQARDGSLVMSDGLVPHIIFDPFKLAVPVGSSFAVHDWEHYSAHVLDVIRSSTGLCVSWAGPGTAILLNLGGGCASNRANRGTTLQGPIIRRHSPPESRSSCSNTNSNSNSNSRSGPSHHGGTGSGNECGSGGCCVAQPATGSPAPTAQDVSTNTELRADNVHAETLTVSAITGGACSTSKSAITGGARSASKPVTSGAPTAVKAGDATASGKSGTAPGAVSGGAQAAPAQEIGAPAAPAQ